jgi:hypothetical protein
MEAQPVWQAHVATAGEADNENSKGMPSDQRDHTDADK